MDISCEIMFACVVPGFPNPLDTIDTTAISVPAHVLEDICNFVRGGDGATCSGSMTLLPLDGKEGGKNEPKSLYDERKALFCQHQRYLRFWRLGTSPPPISKDFFILGRIPPALLYFILS